MDNSLHDIWQRYANGNREAFGEIYQSLFGEIQLYALGMSHDKNVAESLTSDCFTKLLEQPNPGTIENPRAWLYTVCRRAFSTRISTQKRRSELLEDYRGGKQFSSDNQAVRKLEADEIRRWMDEKLSEEEQTIWRLHEEGYTNSEIAEKLWLPEKTVANKKSIARNKLKSALTS